jgi:RHS repeat-associated protein
MVSASATGMTASYAFDGRGRRKLKTVNSITTITITDADNRAVLDYDGTSGAILRWYAYALGPNAVLSQMNVAAGTRTMLVPDTLGSIIGTMDSGATAITPFAYKPYGSASATPATFGYTGQQVDAETGSYYYRARHYSPVLGRFLQADPIGHRGGMHLYAYVANDPLNAFDPQGLLLDSAINTAVGLASDFYQQSILKPISDIQGYGLLREGP